MSEALAAPSAWFTANQARLREAAALGPIVDLASGRGRHALACAELGLDCVAIDRNERFLRELQDRAAGAERRPDCVLSDIEDPRGIPLATGSCGAILVFRFLFRPLAPSIEQALAPGGLLLYETFTEAQLELTWGPVNPEFTLASGELRELFPGLEVVAFEEGVWQREDRSEASARLAAIKSR